jgi:hypothetical protein
LLIPLSVFDTHSFPFQNHSSGALISPSSSYLEYYSFDKELLSTIFSMSSVRPCICSMIELTLKFLKAASTVFIAVEKSFAASTVFSISMPMVFKNLRKSSPAPS